MPTNPPEIFWTKTHDRDDTTKITIMDMCETDDVGYCLTGTLEFDAPQVHYIVKFDAAGNVEWEATSTIYSWTWEENGGVAEMPNGKLVAFFSKKTGPT